MKFQALLIKPTQKIYHKYSVNKSEIRKKILKIRKQSFNKSFNINIKYILRVLRKKKIYGKIVGGYYPFNYEVDTMEILNDFEKQNYKISLPKIKKNFKMDFFDWSIKEPLIVNNYGIPEPTSNEIVYPNIFLVPLVAYDEKFNRIGCMIQIIVNFVFVFVLFFTGQLDFDLTNMANILDIPSLRYASPFRKLAGATVE